MTTLFKIMWFVSLCNISQRVGTNSLQVEGLAGSWSATKDLLNKLCDNITSGGTEFTCGVIWNCNSKERSLTRSTWFCTNQCSMSIQNKWIKLRAGITLNIRTLNEHQVINMQTAFLCSPTNVFIISCSSPAPVYEDWDPTSTHYFWAKQFWLFQMWDVCFFKCSSHWFEVGVDQL